MEFAQDIILVSPIEKIGDVNNKLNSQAIE